MDRLAMTNINGQDARAAMRNPVWDEIDSRSGQVCELATLVTAETANTFSTKNLADIFDLTPSHVRKILSKGPPKPDSHVGRPFTLSRQEENALLLEIEQKAASQGYITQSEIIKWVREKYGKYLTYGWISNFLTRRSGQVIELTVGSQEELRLQVPRIYLQRYLRLIPRVVVGKSLELIFNLEETGISDWEDRRSKKIVAPATLQGRDLHVAVSRKIKHETLLCTVSAAGDAYNPLLISSDEKIGQLFEKLPIRENVDLSVLFKRPAYVNADIFQWYIFNKFMPVIQSERKDGSPEENIAIAFWDNCRCHCSDDLYRSLAEDWILVVTYPPHTSGLFQVLDRLVFGVLKMAKRDVRKDPKLELEIDHARRVFVAYERATGSETVRAAWRRTGFDYIRSHRVWNLEMNSEKIQNFDEFKEIWERNYQESQMTARRQNQKWGWMNKEYFPKEFQKFVEPDDLYDDLY